MKRFAVVVLGAAALALGVASAQAAPTTVLSEGFESGTLGAFGSDVFSCFTSGCGWSAVTTAQHGGTFSAFAPGVDNVSDQRLALTYAFYIPPNATAATLTFWHRFGLDASFGTCSDAAVLETSIDGGVSWNDAGFLITSGGYNNTVNGFTSNPLAGRSAWCGSQSTFSQVTVNLVSLKGQAVRIRFREATDSFTASQGWWVDDVNVDVTASTLLWERFESATLGAFGSDVAQCVPGGCGWSAVTTAQHSGPYSAFAPNVDNVSDQRLVLTNAIVIPANASAATLTFWHRLSLDGGVSAGCFGAGVLETSIDGGASWQDAGPLITSGGYNAPVDATSGNPLAGRGAWCRQQSSFSQVTVNLISFKGQSLKIRFREGTDSVSNPSSYQGWWIDDVVVESNAPPTAVALAAFSARRVGGAVVLRWQTGSEANLAGFHVYRVGGGTSTPVDARLIRAKASPGGGATYRVIDCAARPGVAYRYRLQAVRRDGSRSWLALAPA